MNISFFVGVISIMVVFLYGCIGEIITEKSGHLNLGTPGVMCFGATGAVVGARIFINITGGPDAVRDGAGSPVLGIFLLVLFCLIFAGIAGLLYCFLVDTLRCNQNATGLVITTLGVGIYKFIGSILCPQVDRHGFTAIGRRFFSSPLPVDFRNSNWFTQLFLSYSTLVYIAIIIAIIVFIIIKKTRIGLNLRAVGENPGTSDASGVNVTRYKYVATIVGSLITGLGGLYYLFDYNTGSMEYSLEGLGWIAVALVIFSIWNTGLAVFGSFVFAFFYQLPTPLSNIIKNEAISPLVSTLPYLITILVLITISIFNKKETQPPSALGLTYFREDR
ncbi:MAG: ABC transporter permease [Bacilli bacterium]|nr:ABC transporter permease [Bacilli bacterium]